VLNGSYEGNFGSESISAQMASRDCSRSASSISCGESQAAREADVDVLTTAVSDGYGLGPESARGVLKSDMLLQKCHPDEEMHQDHDNGCSSSGDHFPSAGIILSLQAEGAPGVGIS